MASTNLFDLLEDGAGADPVRPPVITEVPKAVEKIEHKPADRGHTGGHNRGQQHGRSETTRGASSRPSFNSEHHPTRRVYSREWLLEVRKNYAAPQGFDSSNPAFHALSLLPVALLSHTHEVRINNGPSYVIVACARAASHSRMTDGEQTK